MPVRRYISPSHITSEVGPALEVASRVIVNKISSFELTKQFPFAKAVNSIITEPLFISKGPGTYVGARVFSLIKTPSPFVDQIKSTALVDAFEI